MEFSRWRLDRITRISDLYRDFKEFLSEVLEGELGLLEPEAVDGEGGFSPSADFSTLRRMGVRATRVEVFLAMVANFEAGFLLKRDGKSEGVQFLEAMFLHQRVFRARPDEKPRVRLSLPEFQEGRVFRGRIHPVLATFRLDGCEKLRDASAFVSQPARDVVFLLICNRPHPWQVNAIEEAATLINELFAAAEGTES